jgi:C4-dicarboxylate transporter DctM subunit
LVRAFFDNFVYFIFYHLCAVLWGLYAQSESEWAERRRTTIKVAPTLALAGLILGGIYTGVFTPTEAAAVGFSLALLLTVVVLRSLSWADFKKSDF